MINEYITKITGFDLEKINLYFTEIDEEKGSKLDNLKAKKENERRSSLFTVEEVLQIEKAINKLNEYVDEIAKDWKT